MKYLTRPFTILMVLVLTILLATPILAGSRIRIYAIEYNFDAAPSEDAITVYDRSGKNLHVVAGEFEPLRHGQDYETMAEVEARIQDRVQEVYSDYEWITADPEEPDWRFFQDPPILLPYEEIVEVKNDRVHLKTTLTYFGLHIYSLDDPETPESELNFLTIFSRYPIPPNWFPEL